MAVPDVQILVQALVYFLLCVCGLIVSITTGVNRNRFDGSCILYATFTKDSNNRPLMHSSDPENCQFPVYYGVFGMIFWGLAMGIYNTYAMCKSRSDPAIGSQMWVMPFLLLNGVLTIVTMIVACIVSVGFAIFCKNYLGQEPKFVKCSDGQNSKWHRFPDTSKSFDPGNYVDFMSLSMIGAWSGVLCQIILVALGILRFRRNRKLRGQTPSSPREESTDTVPTDDTKTKELQPQF